MGNDNVAETKADATIRSINESYTAFLNSLKKAAALDTSRSNAQSILAAYEGANPEIRNPMSAAANSDKRRPIYALVVLFLLELFLAHKASAHLLFFFHGINNEVYTVILTLLWTITAFTLSFFIRQTALQYKEDQPKLWFFLSFMALIPISMMPVANIYESLLDHNEKFYFETNLILVVMGWTVHFAFILMHKTFANAWAAFKGGIVQNSYAHNVTKAQKSLDNHQAKHLVAQNDFRTAVNEFMAFYQALAEITPHAAQQLINHFDVAMIFFMNAYYGHTILPLHANGDGQIVVRTPHTPDLKYLQELDGLLQNMPVPQNVSTPDTPLPPSGTEDINSSGQPKTGENDGNDTASYGTIFGTMEETEVNDEKYL